MWQGVRWGNTEAPRDVSQRTQGCMQKGDTWKSAIAEYQWDQQHQVDWDEIRVLDRATRPVQLKVEEALHT